VIHFKDRSMNAKDKPKEIMISESILKRMFDHTHKNILRKLSAAKILVDHDAEMSAGLYTYAIEELGKLILLKNCTFQNGECRIKYKEQFLSHSYKFGIAFDFLQENRADQCITLSNGGYSPQGFSWRGFFIGMPADFESRLAIFYSDFMIHNDEAVDTVSIPQVHVDRLITAINGLEKILLQFDHGN
jgi:hypothetical protein